MKRLIGILILGLLLTSCEKNPPKLETTTIRASTMVCGQCEKIIKKAVYAVEGVKEVEVDLDAKTVMVRFVPLQTNVQTLERAITDAGYDANDQKRNPDAYANLPECCKQK